jgi:integrase
VHQADLLAIQASVNRQRHGLGTDETEATSIAIEANLHISAQQANQVSVIRERSLAIAGQGITVSGWLERYKAIQDERLKSGDIRPNTYKQRNEPIALLNQHAGMKMLAEVGAKDIAEILDNYKANGQPRKKVLRQRLDLERWQAIFTVADAKHHYMGNAMLLALVTGQRLGDIANMKFADIWDDHLHIVQEKTGTRLAIPLSLRL